MRNFTFAVVATVMLHASMPAEAQSSPGLTKETAVNTCEPTGEQAYLMQLKCPNGKAPTFAREGNVGQRRPFVASLDRNDIVAATSPTHVLKPGEVDSHMIDKYLLTCEAQPPSTVYLDFYHCADTPSNVPPAGFTMDVDPDVLLQRNTRFRNKVSELHRAEIERLLHCDHTLNVRSKLPSLSAAEQKKMKELYPRLGVYAIMLGATMDNLKSASDEAQRQSVDRAAKGSAMRYVESESSSCMAEFGDQAHPELWNWRSTKMGKLYPESNAAYRP